MIELTRSYRFSASHRLHCRSLSREANRETYGKCNNPFGHGHNYVLSVTVTGPLGDDGRILDTRRLDCLVEQAVIQPMNYRNLNMDVPEFATLVPTTENLTLVIARRLEHRWGQSFEQATLAIARIRLEETANNSFELRLL